MAVRFISLKTIKIFLLFLGIPFVLALCWFAIPLGYKFSFVVSVGIYYSWNFFAWITFFDFIWPNCPKRYLLLSAALFVGLGGLAFYFIWFFELYRHKFAFSLLGVVEVISSTTCYVIHIFNVRKQIREQNHRISVMMGEDTKEKLTEEDLYHISIQGPRVHRHWSRAIYMPLCYLDGVDGIEEENNLAKLQEVEMREEFRSSVKMGEIGTNPMYESESSSHSSEMKETGPSDIEIKLTQLRLHGYDQWSLTTLIYALVFKALMTACWYYLQGFIELARKWGTDQGQSNSSSTQFVIGDVTRAVAAIIIFQITRAIFINLLIAVNLKMPEFLENSYFAQFAVQFLFFFYYRNLFLSVSGWPSTIALNIVVAIFQILVYPVNMSAMVYNFRYRTMKRFITQKATFLRFLLPLFDGDAVSHEKHIKILSVEYYYDELAEYYSLFTFIIFVTLAKYGFTYNLEFYHSFKNLTDEQYLQLLYRYLFLFGFEIVVDFILRWGGKRILKINISQLGRNETIINFRTRYLFTVFLIYFLPIRTIPLPLQMLSSTTKDRTMYNK